MEPNPRASFLATDPASQTQVWEEASNSASEPSWQSPAHTGFLGQVEAVPAGIGHPERAGPSDGSLPREMRHDPALVAGSGGARLEIRRLTDGRPVASGVRFD